MLSGFVVALPKCRMSIGLSGEDVLAHLDAPHLLLRRTGLALNC